MERPRSFKVEPVAKVPAPLHGQWLPAVALTLRLFAIACLATLIFPFYIVSTTILVPDKNGEIAGVKVGFSNFYVYRYMSACAMAGIALTVLLCDIQIKSPPVQECSKNLLASLYHKFKLYNQIMVIILISGGAASAGFTIELSGLPDDVFNRIIDIGLLKCAYLYIGFYLTGLVSNMVSSALWHPDPSWQKGEMLEHNVK